jgi:hypothetical protein
MAEPSCVGGDPPVEPPSVRPPSKAKHELLCQQLQSCLSLQEQERERLSGKARAGRERLKLIRAEREQLAEQRNGVFGELDRVNKEVAKKAESVQKLRSGLSSSSAEAVDLQIRRLEEQINKGHFKLVEERRLVAETDRLRRSRTRIAEWQRQRGELEAMRGEQRVARGAREEWFGASRAARAREEAARQELGAVVGGLEEAKGALEGLREERRQLVVGYRRQEAEWRAAVERRREETRRREEEDRRRVAREREREEEEARAAAEPFYAERCLVQLLLHYCEPLAPPGPSQPSTPGCLHSSTLGDLLSVPGGDLDSRRRSSGFSTSSTCSSYYATPLEHTPARTPTGSPPELSLPGAWARKASLAPEAAGQELLLGKRGKREARRRRSSTAGLRRLLAHSPETFAQFERVGLSPPLAAGSVAEVQARLREKLEDLERRAAMVKLDRLSLAQAGGEVLDKVSTVDPKTVGLPSGAPPTLVLLPPPHRPARPCGINTLITREAGAAGPSENSTDAPDLHDDSKGDIVAIIIENASDEESNVQSKHHNDPQSHKTAPTIVLSSVDSNSEDGSNSAEDAPDNSLGHKEGPTIHVTDCDMEKQSSSKTNRIPALNCIIAR